MAQLIATMLDLNDLIHQALSRREKKSKYYVEVKPGEYRSGSMAGCPWKEALRGEIYRRGEAEKQLQPKDRRYATYGAFIHDGVAKLLVEEQDQKTARVFDEVQTKTKWPTLNCEISSRADLLVVRNVGENVVEWTTVEEKTVSANAVKYYPEKFPYPYNKLQAWIAHLNVVNALQQRLPITWGANSQPLPVDELFPPTKKILGSSLLVYYPREIVRGSPDWFLLRYWWPTSEVDPRWVWRVAQRWQELFLSASKNANVDNREIEEYFRVAGLPDVACENCDVRHLCHRYNPEEFSRYMSRKNP